MATTTATPEPRAFLDTIEGEIALCRSLIYHRPYGLDKHWAMIAIVTALRDSGGPDVEADDVWKKLETMYVSEEIEGVVPSPESPPITEFLEVPFAPIAANSKSLDPSPPTPLSGDESNIPHILKAIMERGLEREADRIKQGGSPQVDEEGFAAEESNVTPRKRARRDDGGNGSARKEDGDEESDLSDLPSEDEEDEEDEEAESGVEETGDEEEEEGESEGEGVEEKKKPSSGKGKKGQATKGGSSTRDRRSSAANSDTAQQIRSLPSSKKARVSTSATRRGRSSSAAPQLPPKAGGRQSRSEANAQKQKDEAEAERRKKSKKKGSK